MCAQILTTSLLGYTRNNDFLSICNPSSFIDARSLIERVDKFKRLPRNILGSTDLVKRKFIKRLNA